MATLLLLLLVVPAAQAGQAVELDREHGVRFTVAGPGLTVALEPQVGISPPDVREKVWGKRVGAVCSPVFTFRDRRLRRVAVTQVQVWPEGQFQLSYTFERDISDRVKWCSLEEVDGGGDVASAGFAPFIRIYADTPRQRRVGRRLRSDLLRGGSEPWFPEAFGIVVGDGSAAISTNLPRDARGRRIARRLCGLVTKSRRAARPTAVYGRADSKLRDCGTAHSR